MTKTFLSTAALGAAMMTSSFGGEVDALDASLINEKKSFWDRFTFGSYGEIHARFIEKGDFNGTDIDPHRIVLFADFQITDNLKLVTETELEHALRKNAGSSSFTSTGVELKLEQAYLEYAASETFTAKGGLILTPVGIINEVHEPTTFYGVERPNVEKNVIPTTWTVLGLGFTNNVGSDWQFDALFHGGNDTKGGTIRGGRSSYGIDLFKVNSEGNRFNQNNSSFAVTGRAKYSGIKNLNLGGSLQYQSDMDSTTTGSQAGTLGEAHAIYTCGGFQFIALGTAWNISDVRSEADSQWGYYLEPSYAWDTPIGKVGVFGRFSQLKYAKLSGSSSATESTEYNLGGNYWINENLVVKADYLNEDFKNKDTQKSLNFGFGWYY
ncbi:hypothetical protein [Rubritalea tangerina]|uniref:Porin n=1 Tax=Rubritalea tangerina TaxID=430798 RepID=A0ABW4Z6L2_9BACT